MGKRKKPMGIARAVLYNTDRCIAACEAYVSEHGDLRVPQKYVTEDGLNLGTWISTQRVANKRGLLKPEIKARLDALGMVWDARIGNTPDVWLDACKKYKEEHGDLLVPVKYVTESGMNLGHWVHSQRSRQKRGLIKPELAKQLDELGMVWTLAHDEEEWLDACRKYKAEHGNLNVPSVYVTENGMKLGCWIHNQRRFHKEGTISPKLARKLDRLGLSWTPRESSQLIYLDACREYKEEHGNLNVPRSYITENGLKLGAWIGHQRRLAKEDRIPPNLKSELNKLGMTWSAVHNSEEWLDICRKYIAEHGHLNVPQRYVMEDGTRLGVWIEAQRVANKNETIAPELKDKLNELGMTWRARRTEEEWLDACREYKKEHGDLLVPAKHVLEDGSHFGMWIGRQRQCFKQGTIDPKIKLELEALGMIWSIHPRNENWLDACKEYKEEHGNILIPTKYVREDGLHLGRWISSQRKALKNDKIDPELKSRLDALGMVWVAPKGAPIRRGNQKAN